MNDFPRVPLTRVRDLFRSLCRAGSELIALHLLESSKPRFGLATFEGKLRPTVERIRYFNKTAWLDAEETSGFRGLPEDIWEFRVGGYQVCEKWLKDRKGRRLSNSEIEHYQKIVVAISETIRIMVEIDKVIDAHGGWPAAFAAQKGKSTEAGTD